MRLPRRIAAPGVVALAIALLCGAPAHLAGAHAGFAAGAADTLPPIEGGVIEVGNAEPPAAARAGDGEAKTAGGKLSPARRPLSGLDAPRWVMARSLVVPGWGQLHNGSWIKAIGIATGEVMLVSRMVDDNQALDALNAAIETARADTNQAAEAVAVEAYNSRLDELTRRQWLFGALLAYSLLDAYIDAHFRDFDIEFSQDPALPGGVPPATGKRKGKAVSGEYRLALRWSF